MRGFHPIYRKLQGHWLWKDRPFAKGQAWIDLLLLANHKNSKVVINNRIIHVSSGQLYRSKRTLGDRWGWSENKVKRFITALQDDQMVEYRPGQYGLLITIRNYNKYHLGQGAATIENELPNESPDGVPGELPGGSPGGPHTTMFNNGGTMYKPIFDHWNTQDIIIHNKLTDKMRTKIRSALKDHTEEEILHGITNYTMVLNGRDHYFNHKWTLQDFLARGLPKFVSAADPLNNFRKDQKPGQQNSSGDHNDPCPKCNGTGKITDDCGDMQYCQCQTAEVQK